MTDIVERLRGVSSKLCREEPTVVIVRCRQAADEIERSHRAEEYHKQAADGYAKQAATLEGDLAELRRSPSPDVAVKALEEIWETIDKNPAGATPVGMILQIGTIARAAIASLSSSNVMGEIDIPMNEYFASLVAAILREAVPYAGERVRLGELVWHNLTSNGLVIVPIEPTEEMLRAGDDAILDDSTPYITHEIYRAMLSASPASPNKKGTP